MAKQSIIINGKTITGAAIGSLTKSLGSIDDNLTLYANAAAAQFVINGNRNWLDSLFGLQELRLKDDKLSAKGKQVRSYIAAFAPVTISEKVDETTKAVSIAFTLNKNGKGVFFSLDKDDKGAKVKVDAAEHTTWPQSLKEFNDAKKPAAKPADAAKKATTLSKSIDKMAESFASDNGITGSLEDYQALAEAAKKLQALAVAKMATAASKNDGVDVNKASELTDVVSGTEKRSDTNREVHANTVQGKLNMPVTDTKAKYNRAKATA